MGDMPLISSTYSKILIQEFNANSAQAPFDVALPSTSYKLVLIEYWPWAGKKAYNLLAAFDPKKDVTSDTSEPASSQAGVLGFYGNSGSAFIRSRKFSYSFESKTISFGSGGSYSFSTGWADSNNVCPVYRIWGVS